MFRVLVMFSLYSAIQSIRIGKVKDYIIFGSPNTSLVNLTQDQCICQMLASSGSVVALNYFPINQTCQLFLPYNNLLMVRYFCNSAFIYINQTSMSITIIQTNTTGDPNCPQNVATNLWSFDNTLKDTSGQFTGVSGTSPTYTNGITGYGSALVLNGNINKCVTVSPFLNMSYTSFTWKLWVYPTATPTGDGMLIAQCNQLYTGRCLHILIRSDKMYFGFFYDDVNGSTLISANQWSHMAFVYDMAMNKKLMYLNGLLEATQNLSPPLQITSTNTTFGCLRDDMGNSFYSSFTGYVDQVTYTSRPKNAREILNDATLTAHFRFLANAPLIDAGPNYINGSWGGGTVSITSGIVNQAINFPVSGSYFQLTGLVLLGTSNWPLSLSVWFKINSLNGGGTIAHLSGTTSGTGWCLKFLGLATDGKIQIQTHTIIANIVLTGPVIPIGVWQHVVYTFSTANGMRLYINGSLSGSIMTTYSASDSPVTLTFGNPLSGTSCGTALPNQQFYGSVDEIRLYSRELTTNDISQLYSNP